MISEINLNLDMSCLFNNLQSEKRAYNTTSVLMIAMTPSSLYTIQFPKYALSHPSNREMLA